MKVRVIAKFPISIEGVQVEPGMVADMKDTDRMNYLRSNGFVEILGENSPKIEALEEPTKKPKNKWGGIKNGN